MLREIGEWRWNWLYKGHSQLLVVSWISFAVIGIYNALSNLAGTADTDDANTILPPAYIVVYFVFTICSLFGGAVFVFLNPKWMIGIGSICYVLFTIFNYVYDHTTWKAVLYYLSGVLVGVGGALLWTATLGVVCSFAPNIRKGHYLSIFWVIFNLGAVIGNFVAFGVSFATIQVQEMSVLVFWIMAIIQIIGTILSFVFVVNPNRVTTENGLEVYIPPPQNTTFFREVKLCLYGIIDKKVLYCIPFYFSLSVFYTYLVTINTLVLNVRTISFTGAIYWIVQMLGSVIFGTILDLKRFKTLSERSSIGFKILVFGNFIAYGYGIYFKYYLKSLSIETSIDFTDSNYAIPLFANIFFGFSDAINQIFAQWMISAVGGSDSLVCSRYIGYYKSFQSLGLTISYIILSQFINYPQLLSLQFYLSLALLLFSLFPLYYGIKEMKNINLNQWKPELNNQTPQVDPGTKTPYPILEEVNINVI